MLMVSQVLPVTGRRGLDVSAATARVEASASRAEDRIRRVRADLRLAFTDLWAAQERERELARSRDRLSELAGVLARREAAATRPDSIGCGPSAKCSTSRRAAPSAATERAQAQAILASFLAAPRDSGRDRGGQAGRAERPCCRPWTNWWRAPRRRAATCVALARELDAAAFAEQAAGRRAIPEPEVVAGTKSSNAAGGDVGSIVSVHVALPLFDRAQPGTRGGAGARPPGARRGRRPSADDARADRARGAPRSSSGARSPNGYRAALGAGAGPDRADRAGQLRRGRARHPRAARRVSHRRRPRACGRRRSTPPCGRPKSSSNSSAAGRFHEDASMTVGVCLADRACSRSRAARRRRRAGRGAADARRDELDRQDRAVHGVPAARGRPDGALRRPPDAAERLLRDDRRPAADRVHAGVRRRRRPCCQGNEPSRPGRLPSRGRRAARGTLPLGARRRRARAVRSSRPRRGHGVRRRGGGRRRRRAARRRGSRGDRLPEGTAVDERVRDGAGAGSRGAACDPGAGRRSSR